MYGVHYESLKTRQLLHVPDDRRPSILQANAVGTTLVFATWDEALFGEWARRLYTEGILPEDEVYQATTSTILRLNTETNQCDEILNVKQFWINHVLLHPTRL